MIESAITADGPEIGDFKSDRSRRRASREQGVRGQFDRVHTGFSASDRKTTPTRRYAACHIARYCPLIAAEFRILDLIDRMCVCRRQCERAKNDYSNQWQWCNSRSVQDFERFHDAVCAGGPQVG